MKRLDIIVCMKPVPDPKRWDKLKLDPETMLLVRGNIPAVINLLDRNAIEQAVTLKAAHGGSISAITMAPPDGEDQLVEALSMGCDCAYLLCDRAFAGADTLATSRCLAAAIRKIGRFDLVFCGGYSADGSTAQVGPQLAELLGLPDLTHATRLEIAEGVVRAHCKLEDGHVVFATELPALVTFDREANTPRLPTMVGIMKAAQTGVVTWTAGDLGIDAELVGLAGSPTQMLNVFTAPVGRKGDMLQGTPNELAAKLLAKLRQERVLS
jgi:electron transfer flavoprotein alpha/beta subunit